MIGEVHYWRDMARILEAINNEVKQFYVEVCIQVLLSSCAEKENTSFKYTVDDFSRERSRVIKGTKEAKWNQKYMKVIEKPVTQIEKASDLKEILLCVGALMKSLKNIYENSNFYKEARIVSFIDRLLQCIDEKIKQKVNINVCIMKGKNDYENFSSIVI